MAEAKGIEVLSVTFTAGVAAGTMVSASFPWAGQALLLPLLAIPVLLYNPLGKARSLPAFTVLLTTFFLLGIFCTLTGNAAGPGVEAPWERWAAASVVRLRACIDALPLEHPGSAPLLKALLTGDRSGLSGETVAVFRRSGASHLLALSGLHIGILYLILDKLSRLPGRSLPVRYVRYGLIVLASGFYTLMTGAGPSIVRAFLFITIRETLRLCGRPQRSIRVLCLALLVQLVLQPEVIGSLGFQLSYLAMGGIFLLYPILERWYPASSRWDPVRKIWTMAALSISCQAFTAPLVWWRFRSLPRHFLLTNLLAIPLTTICVTAAAATVTLSLFGICPLWLVRLCDTACRLLTETLGIIAGM